MRKAALTEAQIRKHLADNLSYLRQAKTPKLSQKAVARILNLPPKTIMNYSDTSGSLGIWLIFVQTGLLSVLKMAGQGWWISPESSWW